MIENKEACENRLNSVIEKSLNKISTYVSFSQAIEITYMMIMSIDICVLPVYQKTI